MAQTYSTTVDLAPMSQSDLRALVENCAASRLLPKDDRLRASDGHVSDHQGSDSDNSSQTSAGTSASGAGSFASTRRAEIVGLPASLHQAIYSQTGGNALFAVATCELLCDSGAVSVTESKTHGVREVKIRADESKLALSASRITSMSLAEVTAENIRRSLSDDAALAVSVLSALGECFGGVHACEVLIRALARKTREEDPHSPMDREEQRLHSEAAARAATLRRRRLRRRVVEHQRRRRAPDLVRAPREGERRARRRGWSRRRRVLGSRGGCRLRAGHPRVPHPRLGLRGRRLRRRGGSRRRRARRVRGRRPGLPAAKTKVHRGSLRRRAARWRGQPGQGRSRRRASIRQRRDSTKRL